ncbi:MAG: DUF4914 family protein [Oscillospiraceae bacterium]|nr:DUF4914 family protein [Oscillospiraceae bacterium]
MSIQTLEKIKFNKEITKVLKECKNVSVPLTREEIIDITLGSPDTDSYDVCYVARGKKYHEASIVRCKNGVAVNYTEDYMRRRDPDCLIIADDLPSDKPRFNDEYGYDFSVLREETFKWLKEQELIVVPFMAGGVHGGYHGALIAPKNAAFFAAGLTGLQLFINAEEFKGTFEPTVVIFLAPPFRHTHLDGKQIVVHNRTPELYEMFSYNLYPGPSAKKGVYGFLLDVAEKDGWVVTHSSAVKVITPYENEIVIMHEGASGGGKSEMGENIHREPDGKILIGQNLMTEENFYLILEEPCELRPISDDMTLCHPSFQNSKRLVICDAEDGWFIRLDHIKEYGTEPHHEKLYVHPSEPLVFINIQGVPGATCLVWEHTADSDGKPCPNPRVVLPRKMVPGIINEPVEVDVRSFGIRTPPCTKKHPSYGIIGMIHILPPALGWLWRLVAPRGHNNPSIIETDGITSEGIGSYGPFLTGTSVNHANLLLAQIQNTQSTRFVLVPNQHIGCYKVGFKPQWLMREYLARRGSARFKPEHLVPARLPILGYCLENLKIDGQFIRTAFLRPETQAEVGTAGYDAGAQQLLEFVKRELLTYDVPQLDPLGKKIIDVCMNDGGLQDYIDLIPIKY